MRKRVYCLYRVSTKGQVEKDDIPMQRQACHEFAKYHGWDIIEEFSEKGISGFKVSAKDRDAIQEIQKAASLDKFDVLLVFMFDRIGRIDDETPFIVEWFVRNGIEVWSTQEGQQRFDSHVDKLMNYIRYWQASGESIKTSIRTKTRLAQIVQEGKFRGGIAPYGYKLVKNGRIGKKNRELFDIQVDEDEAVIVRKMFDKYANWGFGARRIASALQEEGIRNRSGEMFHYSTIQNIIKNITYVGILRSGETKSEVFPELQIIDAETFERANTIMKQRSNTYDEFLKAPRHTLGKALLSGNVYCGHCGGRIFATTAKLKRSPLQEGEISPRLPIYKCYNRTQHQSLCDGPTTYRAIRIDEIIRKMLAEIFERAKGIEENELVDLAFREQTKELALQLKKARGDYAIKTRELEKLDALMVGAVEGANGFTPERLMRRMDNVEAEIKLLGNEINSLQVKTSETTSMQKKIQQEHRQMVTWAEVFNGASIEVQKMIASSMIKAVKIRRDYEIDVEYNFDEHQYDMGLEM